jgi:hypothetical protein
LRVHFEHPVQVPREIDADRDIAALAREARAAATREDRGVMLSADADCFDDLLPGARADDAKRDLPIIGGVGSV